MTIEALPPRQPGVVAYRVFVTVRKNAPPGELKHVIQLQTNGDPQMLDIVVEGFVQSPITATPNAVNFGKVTVKRSGVAAYRGAQQQ